MRGPHGSSGVPSKRERSFGEGGRGQNGEGVWQRGAFCLDVFTLYEEGEFNYIIRDEILKG